MGHRTRTQTLPQTLMMTSTKSQRTWMKPRQRSMDWPAPLAVGQQQMTRTMIMRSRPANLQKVSVYSLGQSTWQVLHGPRGCGSAYPLAFSV